VLGVLDADSESFGSFDQVDAENLERIVRLIYSD
jgi:putative methionine-R-sulfoxide reductase with GAF domain